MQILYIFNNSLSCTFLLMYECCLCFSSLHPNKMPESLQLTPATNVEEQQLYFDSLPDDRASDFGTRHFWPLLQVESPWEGDPCFLFELSPAEPREYKPRHHLKQSSTDPL